MASITVRNGRYLMRVRRDGYPSIAKSFSKKSDGLAWARRVEADMESGRWAAEAQAVPTLYRAICEYRTTVGPPGGAGALGAQAAGCASSRPGVGRGLVDG